MLHTVKLILRSGGALFSDLNGTSRYIAPTLPDHITWEHPVMQEEILGPVLPILTYRKLKEAIDAVNAHKKPLVLYFFSSSEEKKEAVLRVRAVWRRLHQRYGLAPGQPQPALWRCGRQRHGQLPRQEQLRSVLAPKRRYAPQC